MKNYIYLTLFLLSICYSNLGATDKYSIQTEYKYVSAKSGLNFRDKPKGAVLGKFTFGKKVGVIEHSKVFETITDDNKQKKGEWVGIQQGSEIVYVFDAYLSSTTPNVYEILSPGTYLTKSIEDNPVDFINTHWLELHKKNEQFFLEKAKYDIHGGYFDCTGLSKTIRAKNETLIYLNNSSLNSGRVKSLTIHENRIWPKEKINFSYKDTRYVLHAEGDKLSPKRHSEDALSHEVENYKLYLSVNNNPQLLILEESHFNNGFVKLLFVGDIDSDDILDFVFESSKHYTSKRVILFLSSSAEEGENYHASETTAIIDC